LFTLPNFPSPRAEIHEIADFAELKCWLRGSVSSREILAYLGRIDENEEETTGCDDIDDKNSNMLDEVMNEIYSRSKECNGGYPFQLNKEGTVIYYKPEKSSPRPLLYNYLLLSTRLNMKNNNVQASIDGCLLFEEICAHILRNYLGGERAKSLIFGTAAPGSFKEKIKTLCNELKEGAGFKNPDFAYPTKNDGGLDIVAWIPFSDRKAGQLIIFSQCKTGTSWKDDACKLRPETFIKNWIDGSIATEPVRTLCVSEACDRSRWNSCCNEAGLLIDRCRIVDFSDNLNSDVLRKIHKWTISGQNSVVFNPPTNKLSRKKAKPKKK
jgi:hypothetical protein